MMEGMEMTKRAHRREEEEEEVCAPPNGSSQAPTIISRDRGCIMSDSSCCEEAAGLSTEDG